MTLHIAHLAPAAESLKRVRFAFLAFVVFMAGCASQVDLIEPVTKETVRAPNEGYVVARIINASSYPAPLNQLTITPQNLNVSEEGKFQRLLARESRFNGTSVFASPVAAGKYSLTGLRAFHSGGQGYYSHGVPAGTDAGTFDVKPGQVTDLGLLVYYQKSDGDNYYKEIIRIPGTPGEVLDKYFSFIDVDKSILLGWDDDGLDDERNTFFVSAAQNPTTFEQRYLAPDGAVYFLGKLGVILKRAASGDWELDVVDTNLDLTAIAQNERGDLVVGGSEGRLFVKKLGGEWTDVSIDHNFDVEQISFHNQETIEMIALEKLSLSVFRNDINDPELKWNEINTYNTMQLWKNSPPPTEEQLKSRKRPKRIIRSELEEVDGQNYVSIYTLPATTSPLFGQAKPSHYRYSPDNWEPVAAEEMPEIVTSISAGKSKLGIQSPGFWSWSGRPTYSRYAASTDSWQEINTFVYRCGKELVAGNSCEVDEKSGKATTAKRASFSFLSVPWFTNEQEAIAVVRFTDTDFWSGKTDYDVKILATADGGITWTDTERTLPDQFCTTFVPEISDRILLSCSTTGDFYESTDLAETWVHIRQHESF